MTFIFSIVMCGKLLSLERCRFHDTQPLYSGLYPRSRATQSSVGSAQLPPLLYMCGEGVQQASSSDLEGRKSLLTRPWYGLGHYHTARCVQTAGAALFQRCNHDPPILRPAPRQKSFKRSVLSQSHRTYWSPLMLMPAPLSGSVFFTLK